MKIVMAFGTFDSLHPGHLFYLREAKKHGKLVVVLARDRTVVEVKGKMPKYGEQERKQHLETTGIPDQVVLGSEGDKYGVIEELAPDIICLGYDQKFFADRLEEELKKRGLHARIIRIPPYKEDIFKSSKLK